MTTDLDAYWMPFTANRQFKKSPRLFTTAKGMHFWTDDGRQVLDGIAGLWCVNAGHGRTKITEAIQRQAAEMDFCPPFQMAHPKAFALAEKVAALAPEGMNRVFFTNSGSESVETALKMAIAYHRVRGEGARTRLIGRERGYHGVNFGGISVGGIVANRKMFGTMLGGVDHIRHTHDPARNAFSVGQPAYGAEFADDLEKVIALHDASTIAAVIVEPVAGSTGVLVPPQGYLQRLRAITKHYGILLIFDEVITGFGRLGTATAAEYFGVTPDILTMAKGLTNGAVPMGAVAVGREIHDTVVNNSPDGIEFYHGYTYSGHPLAAAAVVATLKLYEDEGTFAHSASLSQAWEDAVHALRGCPNVIDIRNLGLVAAVELSSRDGAPGARAMEAFHRAFDAGLLIRVTGDIIALSPPLIVSESQITEMFDVLAEVLRQTA